MSQYYEIKITGGTSPGKYSLYYDQVNTGTLLKDYPFNNLMTGLTLSQLTTGVLVETPTAASKIILFNDGKKCKNQIIFELDPQPEEYPCLCLSIFNISSLQKNNYDFCYNGVKLNSKPLYTSNSNPYKLVWNSNGYWDLSGYTDNGVIFRSDDNDNVPETNWEAIALNPNDFVILSQTGNCSNVISNFVFLDAKGFDADCGESNGSILATALGGAGSWKYSINAGSTFQQTNLFGSLPKGTYTVLAEDEDGTIVSEIVVVGGLDVNEFSLQAQSQTTKKLSKIGFTQFYETTIVYDTSFIPAGEQITFNYVIEFNLNYVQPGSAKFDVEDSNLQIFKNGITQGTPSQVDLQNITQVSPSSCDPSYSIYQGFVKYKTGLITLDNNDNFEVKFVYGINTDELGVFDNTTQCFTQASVNISSYVTDTIYTCSCCSLIDTIVTTSINQIYQP